MSIEGRGYRPPNEQKEVEKDQKIIGTIKRWNPEKGFGFLSLANKSDVFCHVNDLCEHLRPDFGKAPALGAKVNIGRIVEGNKGKAAKEVQCDECIAPDKWELRPTGPAIFGVQELQAINVNKPNAPSYKSPITYDQVQKANEPFREALKKKNLWNQDRLASNFFDEFGEPQSVQAEGEDKIILTYSFGTKEVSSSDGFESKHWETSPSNKWREGTFRNSTGIEAEFLFNDIPNAKVWKEVAYLSKPEGYYTDPYLTKNFDLLSAAAQKEVISRVKQTIKSPEAIADNHWQSFAESATLPSKDIAQIRSNLIALQAPGEMYITQSSRKTAVAVAESEDERRSAGTIDVMVTTWNLVVGARKAEQVRQLGEYTGGKSFSLGSNEYARGATLKETAEQARVRLLAENQKRLEELEEKAGQIRLPSPDPRLYDLTPEERVEKYQQRWQTLQQQAEQQWREEDGRQLEQLKKDWDMYETTAAELRHAREEVTAVNKRARDLRVTLKDEGSLHSGNIGINTLEGLQECVVAFRQYVTEANEHIAQELKARGEQEIAATKGKEQAEQELREAMEAPADPASWYLMGIEPSVLEAYGRKQGQGFGAKVAGKPLYLPGNRAVVGIRFGGRTSRYGTEIVTKGLTGIESYLPTGAGKRGADLLAVVQDPTWNVRWTSLHDGMPTGYTLASTEGITYLTEGGSCFRQQKWDGSDWKNGAHAALAREEFKFTVGSADAETEFSAEKSESTDARTEEKTESKPLSKLEIDKKGWWSHELSGGIKHSGKLSKSDKIAYDAGQGVEIVCESCSSHPVVGYAKKE